MEGRLEELRRQARAEIRRHYRTAAAMGGVDIQQLNRARPPSMRYRSTAELVHEFLSRAAAVLDFAGRLELITQEQAAELLREFMATHPELELGAEEDDAWHDDWRRDLDGRER